MSTSKNKISFVYVASWQVPGMHVAVSDRIFSSEEGAWNYIERNVYTRYAETNSPIIGAEFDIKNKEFGIFFDTDNPNYQYIVYKVYKRVVY